VKIQAASASAKLQSYVGKTIPSKLIRQTLVSTCSLRVESLHTLFAGCRPTAVLTGTSNNQVPSIKSGKWWSANNALAFDNIR